MDLLCLSPALSSPPCSLKSHHFHPKFLPKTPLKWASVEVGSHLESPNINPTKKPAFIPPRISLKPHQNTHFDTPFDLSLDDMGLGPVLGPAGAAPQTQETAMRGAESDVMGMLFKQRIVFLGSGIDDLVADAVISQLMLLDAQDCTKDIRLFINSSGGSLSATMAIYDVLQLVRSEISTVALGISASTASILLTGGARGKRLAMPNTRIMIHQPQGGASGKAIDVAIQAREILENKNNVIRIISERTGRSFEQVEKDLDRDRYMSPIEAVEYGLIDGVIDRDKIIPVPTLPERVKSRYSSEIRKDPDKFLIPEIPDDEIY